MFKLRKEFVKSAKIYLVLYKKLINTQTYPHINMHFMTSNHLGFDLSIILSINCG